MEQNSLISIIVPVYNVEKYLPKCVDSLLAQTHENLEIILVDDGTKDNSDKLCDEYAAKDSRVKVIHKENGGAASARNAGIDIAQGEYLAFADSDDWLEPDAYAHMLALAQKYGVKLVCAGRYDVSEKTAETKIGLCPQKEEAISGTELVRRIFRWDNVDSAPWDKLFHCSLFREIRYPIGKICEDVAIIYQLALKAEKAAMCDKPIYHYLCRGGSLTNSAVSEKTFHFSHYTALIYADIRAHYPDLEPEARYLRVRSLVHNVQSLDLAGKDAKQKFAEIYHSSRKELRSHIPFIRTCGFFTGKERTADILLALGLYSGLRTLYHGLKGHNG